mmetsp:Transcript_50437/g.107422  ORF Transcript_50437/g.107422 Transcript_50437/m.107422 type:complete len:261 (-) Transcript_50437:98-880(-)|eukprot:CAMPEP_0172555402 /NCGR_PEP_ID=MMETSP1067-20121228/58399_1 /TAXON_ID=265564 ORGANISM="Thalassiosira punctigera, Strain Tpunct2005C2" /NCGR_SAMPLE_ID=MMETSP1067 /ASSEMBLY_ACC=CAM_ASM_000444 /LENGTH=260 /DNA_ID=CAMNT_0013343919 /DNA_START=116 /DNA_END=898 /DNA_ORIENTATION=-
MAPNPSILFFLFAWASFFLLSCSIIDAAEISDNVDCPGPDEAFVTTCSGPESPPRPNDDVPPASVETEGVELMDMSDLVDEVLQETRGDDSRSHKAHNSASNQPNNDNDFQQDFNSGEAGVGYAAEGSAMQQMKQTTRQLMERYYEPLPRQGKCAIGTVCGFAASRLSLGVANRVFRLAGATWVLSEAMHTSGFCDEAKCMPEEARPWVGILRNAMIKKCIWVRSIARRMWDQDRIREIVQRDEMVAGGFAAGAFIGFVV